MGFDTICHFEGKIVMEYWRSDRVCFLLRNFYFVGYEWKGQINKPTSSHYIDQMGMNYPYSLG